MELIVTNKTDESQFDGFFRLKFKKGSDVPEELLELARIEAKEIVLGKNPDMFSGYGIETVDGKQKVVSYSTLLYRPSEKNIYIGYIETNPKFRGLNYGSTLLHELKAFAKKNGVTNFSIIPLSGRAPFFLKNGFTNDNKSSMRMVCDLENFKMKNKEEMVK